jgi:cysteinyl-tRNA synthetase
MTAVLGVSPKEEPWVSFGSGGDAALRAAVDALVAAALEERAAARQRRDFAAADAVRDRLADAGIRVEDTPSGPRWSLAGGS